MRHRDGSLNVTDATAGLRARLRLWAVLTIVALLPLVNLWTIDQLDRHHRSISETPANALVKSFAIDPPWRASATRADAALATAGPDVTSPAVRKSEAPPARMAIVTTVGLPATRTLMTPTSFWHSPEMIAAFVANATLVGLVVALLLGGSSPPAARSVGPGAPAIAPPEVTASDAVNGEAHARDDLVRLAHQVRQEVGDTVHALRTPISIIMGYSDALKRTIPQDNVKAWRAIEALEISTGRLNSAVDRTWQRGDGLAQLFLAGRQRVNLAELLRAWLDDGSAPLERVSIEPGCGDACVATAPAGVLEEALDDVLASLEEATSSRCAVRLESRAGEVAISFDSRGATMENEDGIVVDEHQLRIWPKLFDAARNVRMLGGHLAVRTGRQGPVQIVLTLPAAAPEVRPGANNSRAGGAASPSCCLGHMPPSSNAATRQIV